MEAPGFWDDQQKAARISSERARVQRKLETMGSLESEVAELDSMLELADEEPEWRDELERSVDRLSGDVGRLQEDALFTGEYDSGPAVVTHPRRRRRHRQPGLDGDPVAHVPALGRLRAGSRSRCSTRPRARRPA